MKYKITTRESTLVDMIFKTKGEAMNQMSIYEKEDRKNDCYTPDYYIIKEVD